MSPTPRSWALLGKTEHLVADCRVSSRSDDKMRVGVLRGSGRGMRPSREECACNTNRAHEDVYIFCEMAQYSASLSQTLKCFCVCDTCEVRCIVYTLRRLQGNRHFLSKQMITTSSTAAGFPVLDVEKV